MAMVVTHTLENDTGTEDGGDNGGQTRLRKADIGSATGSISSTFDGNTEVGATERGLRREGVVGLQEVLVNGELVGGKPCHP